jgi:hypothetical protein
MTFFLLFFLQYSEVSNERSENASKAQEAWKIIATLAQRTKILETSQQRIHNSFKPKGKS